MIRSALVALALATGLSACNPTLVAQTPAPPGRAARLDSVDGFWGVKHYRMEITQGVAMAFTCMSGGPCETVTVVSENPAIAETRIASLGMLQPNGGGPSHHHGPTTNSWQNQATAAAVVVVGKAPGTTRVLLRSKDGNRTIVVTVVPPPKPIPTATQAATR